VPSGWVFGHNSSATSGSFTIWRILRRTNSATISFASMFVLMSLKEPVNLKPLRDSHARSSISSRSSSLTSNTDRSIRCPISTAAEAVLFIISRYLP